MSATQEKNDGQEQIQDEIQEEVKALKQQRAVLRRKLTNARKAVEVQLEDKCCSKRALRINLKHMKKLFGEIKDKSPERSRLTKEDPSPNDTSAENLEVMNQVEHILAAQEQEDASDEEDEPDWTDKKYEFLTEDLEGLRYELEQQCYFQDRKTVAERSESPQPRAAERASVLESKVIHPSACCLDLWLQTGRNEFLNQHLCRLFDHRLPSSCEAGIFDCQSACGRTPRS